MGSRNPASRRQKWRLEEIGSGTRVCRAAASRAFLIWMESSIIDPLRARMMASGESKGKKCMYFSGIVEHWLAKGRSLLQAIQISATGIQPKKCGTG